MTLSHLFKRGTQQESQWAVYYTSEPAEPLTTGNENPTEHFHPLQPNGLFLLKADR